MASATQVKQSYAIEEIIFITLKSDKSTFGLKPCTIFINKRRADKFEEQLYVFRPKAYVAEKQQTKPVLRMRLI